MNMKLGIAGLGSISTRFATVLREVDGVELAAVASREQTRSQRFATEFGAKKAFDSYSDMITDDSVEAVYIGLTHNFHFEIARLCLEHHKAVLIEKPMVITRKDAEELSQLAQANNTLLVEALWTRFQPAYFKAQEWVKDNRIGELQLITADYHHQVAYDPHNRFYNPKLAGGSLFDVGVYPIGLAIGLMGAAPIAVSGQAKLTPSRVDQSAAWTMRFSNGCLANLSSGFSINTFEQAVIYGQEGAIVLDKSSGPKRCELYDNRQQLIAHFEDAAGDGFVHQIRRFADLYRQGKVESDLIPWRDSIACAGVFDSLRSQWGLM